MNCGPLIVVVTLIEGVDKSETSVLDTGFGIILVEFRRGTLGAGGISFICFAVMAGGCETLTETLALRAGYLVNNVELDRTDPVQS